MIKNRNETSAAMDKALKIWNRQRQDMRQSAKGE